MVTRSRQYAIGEVVSLLREDYSDIALNALRELEREGLVFPDRTPSGYRMYSDDDVDRLRWILRQQREQQWSLDQLRSQLDEPGFDPVAAVEPRSTSFAFPERSLFDQDELDDLDSEPEFSPEPELEEVPDPMPEPEPESEPSDEPEPAPAGRQGRSTSRASSAGAKGRGRGGSVQSSASLTAGELAGAVGQKAHFVHQLDRLGLIAGTATESGPVYGEESLLVARAAAALVQAGLELRHLRMYRVAADREAGILAQLGQAHVLRRRDGAAEAVAELASLLEHGDTIRRTLLRRDLGLGVDG